MLAFYMLATAMSLNAHIDDANDFAFVKNHIHNHIDSHDHEDESHEHHHHHDHDSESNDEKSETNFGKADFKIDHHSHHEHIHVKISPVKIVNPIFIVAYLSSTDIDFDIETDDKQTYLGTYIVNFETEYVISSRAFRAPPFFNC